MPSIKFDTKLKSMLLDRKNKGVQLPNFNFHLDAIFVDENSPKFQEARWNFLFFSKNAILPGKMD